MSRDKNKYKYKKKGDIDRRDKKKSREKDKRNSEKQKLCHKVSIITKFLGLTKALEMHIFQIHEKRGTKTDKVKFE